MTPTEFIEALSRHYSKRHASEQAEDLWIADMVAIVSHTDRRVLARAYQLIRDEHEERAFPLPATILKFTTRAAEQLYPENRSTPEHERVYPWSNRSHRRPDTPAEIETHRRANEWQHAVIKHYGSWAAHWQATKHLHVKPAEKRKPEPGTELPPTADVSRPGFEAMQKRSRTGLHVDISAVTKRITGERE